MNKLKLFVIPKQLFNLTQDLFMLLFLVALALCLLIDVLYAEQTPIDELLVPQIPKRPSLDTLVNHKKEIKAEPSLGVEEYKLNGQLYKAKITPILGPSYYLIDPTGHDMFQPKINNLESNDIPNWVFFSWQSK